MSFCSTKKRIAHLALCQALFMVFFTLCADLVNRNKVNKMWKKASFLSQETQNRHFRGQNGWKDLCLPFFRYQVCEVSNSHSMQKIQCPCHTNGKILNNIHSILYVLIALLTFLKLQMVLIIFSSSLQLFHEFTPLTDNGCLSFQVLYF